jgi:hypothetical protein
MLNQSPVVVALAFGSFIAFGVWYIGVDLYWITYPVIASLAGFACKIWLETVARGKIMGGGSGPK